MDRLPPHTENIGQLSDREFDELEDYSEELAKSHGTSVSADAFDNLVSEAIDRLPEEFRVHLEAVPVIVSDLGRQHGAYGLYQGDTVAYDNYPDRILIFRDTLLHDFGHEPAMLVAQVERTLRHELAHHLGWDEQGVAGLGL